MTAVSQFGARLARAERVQQTVHNFAAAHVREVLGLSSDAPDEDVAARVSDLVRSDPEWRSQEDTEKLARLGDLAAATQKVLARNEVEQTLAEVPERARIFRSEFGKAVGAGPATITVDDVPAAYRERFQELQEKAILSDDPRAAAEILALRVAGRLDPHAALASCEIQPGDDLATQYAKEEKLNRLMTLDLQGDPFAPLDPGPVTSLGRRVSDLTIDELNSVLVNSAAEAASQPATAVGAGRPLTADESAGISQMQADISRWDSEKSA